MKKCSLLCLLLIGSLSVFSQNAPRASQSQAPSHNSQNEARLSLNDGWTLQSSIKVGQKGDVLSTPKFQPNGWYSVSVPTTVVAALVKHKVYPDPDFGMNLRSLPGVAYPIGTNFSNIAMPPDSPFAVSWWYRKEFAIPAAYKGKNIWLNFGGINYRANVWLNGKQIANSDDVAGAWRTYEFNVTEAAQPGKKNVLAVQVYAPTETDLAITFVDWNPAPPDKNMGLWRAVDVRTSGPVALRYPTVVSKVDSPDNNKAHLTITALVKNGTSQPVKGTLKGKIENVEFSHDVELAANESKNVTFDPDQVPQLNIDNPRLWWPKQMGQPNLYTLNMEFDVDGKASDQSETHFGIRQITSELNENKHRVFSINGKKILIRGGGWSPDMILREDSQRMKDELRYVQDMGLNTVRLEGKLEVPEFFDYADRNGILVMAGWCCCDHWEHWPKWSPQDFSIAEQSLRDQMYRLRSHPSLVMWLNGSDNPPPPDVEQTYLKVEKELLWPNPVVSSATAKPTSVTGDSGVKMTGPYEYIAPAYWLQDTPSAQPPHQCNPGGCGGAYGFNTETSMGPAVPPIESIRAMVGKDHLWPIDDTWNYHAGGGVFKDIHVFTDALNARYGKAESVEDYALKSQLQTYEGIRVMYEGYSRNKYASTGVIQWMLNNAWPSMIWHLYDYYLRPGGGYFGAKKAMEPLHPVYGYDDHSISIISSQYEEANGLKLTTKILNVDLTEKFSQQSTVDVPADGVSKVFILPNVDGLSPAYFVVLRLENAEGKLVGSNFYWLSSKQETMDWAKSNWYTTPTESYADFTALSQLPKVKLKVTDRTERKGEDAVTHVTLENPSKSLAFFVRLKVDKGKEEILPVLWQDNYISLLPGEKREISATYRASELGATKPVVEVSGWNVE
ncbi:MAG: glycoside hydrolase family 2, sugar binding [Acidobacteriaceae bacterium]|nr:glycoside hydrolase family 2, sugar binding [Acidobacteriaceae bacterium]